MTDKKQDKEEKKKNKRGKKPRYPGEDSARLSILLRPRYKKALELLAAQRGTTISEAAELVISKFACDRKIDGKPLIDYVRHYLEPFHRYFHAVDNSYFTITDFEREQRAIAFSDRLQELSLIPPSLQKPYEIYRLSVLNRLNLIDVDLGNVFEWWRLNEAINEDWKEGRSFDEVCLLITLASKAIQAKHLLLLASGDKNIQYEGTGYVLASESELELLEKYMKFQDWDKCKSFFKVTKHSVI